LAFITKYAPSHLFQLNVNYLWRLTKGSILNNCRPG
jgi:hypothetical protein